LQTLSCKELFTSFEQGAKTVVKHARHLFLQQWNVWRLCKTNLGYFCLCYSLWSGAEKAIGKAICIDCGKAVKEEHITANVIKVNVPLRYVD
jgi:hypothetical protein